MKNAPSIERLRAAFPSVTTERLTAVRDSIHQKRGMNAINQALDNFGVEHISNAAGTEIASYSNSGDTYAPTILYVYATGSYRLTTVGDFVETYERNRGKLT